MVLDISFIEKSGIAIRCDTQEEAQMLCDAVCEAHPEVRKYLQPKVDNFYGEAESDGLCFRIERVKSHYDVGYSAPRYYRDFHYKIIDFHEIIVDSDLGEIKSGFFDQKEALSYLF